jgi:hypothetical protein
MAFKLIMVGFALIYPVVIWAILRFIIVPYWVRINRFFAIREQDRFKYVRRGKNGPIVKILYRIPGIDVDQRTGVVTYQTDAWENIYEQSDTQKEKTIGKRVIPSKAKDNQGHGFSGLIEWLFGAYYIGLPPNQLGRTKVTYSRPYRPEDEKKARDASKDEGYVIDKEHNYVERTTKSWWHPWKQIIAVVLKEVEVKGYAVSASALNTSALGDTSPAPEKEIRTGHVRITHWGTAIVETVNALTPVITLNGDYLHPFLDNIEGVSSDYFSGKTIDEIRTEPKGTSKGEPSLFERAMMNASAGQTGTELTIGLKINAYNFGGFNTSDKKVEEAIEKRAVARIEAETEAVRGEGEGLRQKNRGELGALGYKAEVNALGEFAGSILTARENAVGATGFHGTGALVQPGASAAMVSVSSAPRALPDKPAEEKPDEAKSEETDKKEGEKQKKQEHNKPKDPDKKGGPKDQRDNKGKNKDDQSKKGQPPK